MKLVLAFLALAATPSRGAEPEGAPTLASQVDAVFAEYDSTVTPGCALAVIQDGQVVYRRGYGMADLDHDVPLTAGSPFHVASVSKQFTAAAVLLLAADGKLALDDEVRKYVPEVPDLGRPVTLRQLIHHTSGLRDQWDLLDLAGWRYSLDLITDDDVLSVVSRQKGLNFPPGERFLYSNTGYTLLAQVVKRVSGQTFRELTSARIFRPLGMASTFFRDDHAEIVKHQALGYEPAEPAEGGGRPTYRLSVTNFDTVGATSLVTTVEDLARWDQNFYDPRVGGEGFLRQMLETGILASGEKLDYAAGLSLGEYRGQKTVEHGGADAGYRATLLRFPERRFSVACLCNLSTTNPSQLSRKVADLYLADVLAPADPAGGAEPETVPLALERLAALAGLYWSRDDVAAVRLVLDGDKLFAAPSPEQRYELLPTSETTFRLGGLPLELRLEATGAGRPRLALVNAGGKTTRTYEPALEVQPTAKDLAALAGEYRSAEIDPVYRLDVEDGRLVLKRLKARPDVLEPLFADTFQGSVGILQFRRSAKGKPAGFTLSTGRVRNMVFEKARP